ncbi:MAG TPA: redox-sensing transcriptional repressor Rex [Blastocatellia bacterium]|nr:redox-sensing transcriptional repressor Rex [Blastocatellia bacterium]
MKTEKISELTTNRLSVYLRCLNELDGAGVETISSQAMAEQFNLNSAQIRKDLAYFGEFGVRGVGYYVKELREHIRQILGLTSDHHIAVIGAGHLGMALANYQGFNINSFHIVALFDSDPEKVGETSRTGMPVYNISQLTEVIKREAIDIAVIAVPAANAEQVFEVVIDAGIKAVLNFAPVLLKPPPGVKIKNVDMTISLESLSYFLARPQSAGASEPGEALNGFPYFDDQETSGADNASNQSR